MKTSEVVFDSWAWIEILLGTPTGERLWKHVQKRRVVTPAMAIAEVFRKVHAEQGLKAADEFVQSARIRTTIQPLDDDIAMTAGQLWHHLRKRDKSASLADATMLATARRLGIPLISRDPCFKGCADVRPE